MASVLLCPLKLMTKTLVINVSTGYREYCDKLPPDTIVSLILLEYFL